MKYIIINADDYGMTPAISKGIRKAFKEGILTSTTAMATGLDIENALKEYKLSCKDMGLRVHLTVTSYDSMLASSRVASLISQETGKFHSLSDLLIKAEANEIDYDELYNEWKSQINYIGNICNDIDHLDSHHYACYINSEFMQVMIELACEFSLPVRYPVGPGINNNDNLEKSLNTMYASGIKTTNHYFGQYTKSGGTLESLLDIYENLQEGYTEILTHCGFVDEMLRGLSSLTDSREVELLNLINPDMIEKFTSNDVELCKFSNI